MHNYVLDDLPICSHISIPGEYYSETWCFIQNLLFVEVGGMPWRSESLRIGSSLGRKVTKVSGSTEWKFLSEIMS